MENHISSIDDLSDPEVIAVMGNIHPDSSLDADIGLTLTMTTMRPVFIVDDRGNELITAIRERFAALMVTA